MIILAAFLILLGSQAFAQNDCTTDGMSCTHKFDFAEPDGWGPEWSTETLPDAYKYGDNRVAHGLGFMRVLTLPWTTFVGNNSHLRWNGTTGFLNASATIEFFVVKGSTGWFDKKTDGYNPFVDCHWDTAPTRASDALFCVHVCDTGDSWIAVCLGGDMLSLGKSTLIDNDHESAPYSLLVAVQKLPGVAIPSVLGYVQMPEIPLDRVSAQRVLSVTAAQDSKKKWFARVKTGVDGSTFGSSFPLIEAPALDALIGFGGSTLPASSCIYNPGGEIARAIAVKEVSAWR